MSLDISCYQLDTLTVLSYCNTVMQTGQQINKPDKSQMQRASFRQRLAAGIILLTVLAGFAVLYLAGRGAIDLGRWLDPCGFKQRYNLPCPACGMTTSAVAFAGGKIIKSLYIQPAAWLFCSVLVVGAFFAFIIAVFGIYFRFIGRFFAEVGVRYIILAVIVVVLAGWAVTLSRALAAKG